MAQLHEFQPGVGGASEWRALAVEHWRAASIIYEQALATKSIGSAEYADLSVAACSARCDAGEELITSSHFNAARDEFERAASLNATCGPRAVVGMARTYVAEGRIKEALAQFETVYGSMKCHGGEVGACTAIALHDYGIALFRMGIYRKAAWALSEAARLEASAVKSHKPLHSGSSTSLGIAELVYLAGTALFSAGDLEGAASELHRALELDPHHFRAFNNLGAVHFERAEWGIAVEHFSRALMICRRYGEGELSSAQTGGADTTKANVLRLTSSGKRAAITEKDFLAAKQEVLIRLNVAESLRQQDRLDASAFHLRTALRVISAVPTTSTSAPRSYFEVGAQVRWNLAALLIDRNEHLAAAALLRESLKALRQHATFLPRDSEQLKTLELMIDATLRELGLVLMRANRLTEASETFSALILARSDNALSPERLLDLGNAKFFRGDTPGAAEDYRRTISLCEKQQCIARLRAAAHLNLGIASAGLQDTQTSSVHFERAIEADPTCTEALEASRKLEMQGRRAQLSPIFVQPLALPLFSSLPHRFWTFQPWS